MPRSHTADRHEGSQPLSSPASVKVSPYCSNQRGEEEEEPVVAHVGASTSTATAGSGAGSSSGLQKRNTSRMSTSVLSSAGEESVHVKEAFLTVPPPPFASDDGAVFISGDTSSITAQPQSKKKKKTKKKKKKLSVAGDRLDGLTEAPMEGGRLDRMNAGATMDAPMSNAALSHPPPPSAQLPHQSYRFYPPGGMAGGAGTRDGYGAHGPGGLHGAYPHPYAYGAGHEGGRPMGSPATTMAGSFQANSGSGAGPADPHARHAMHVGDVMLPQYYSYGRGGAGPYDYPLPHPYPHHPHHQHHPHGGEYYGPMGTMCCPPQDVGAAALSPPNTHTSSPRPSSSSSHVGRAPYISTTNVRNASAGHQSSTGPLPASEGTDGASNAPAVAPTYPANVSGTDRHTAHNSYAGAPSPFQPQPPHSPLQPSSPMQMRLLQNGAPANSTALTNAGSRYGPPHHRYRQHQPPNVVPTHASPSSSGAPPDAQLYANRTHVGSVGPYVATAATTPAAAYEGPSPTSNASDTAYAAASGTSTGSVRPTSTSSYDQTNTTNHTNGSYARGPNGFFRTQSHRQGRAGQASGTPSACESYRSGMGPHAWYGSGGGGGMAPAWGPQFGDPYGPPGPMPHGSAGEDDADPSASIGNSAHHIADGRGSQGSAPDASTNSMNDNSYAGRQNALDASNSPHGASAGPRTMGSFHAGAQTSSSCAGRSASAHTADRLRGSPLPPSTRGTASDGSRQRVALKHRRADCGVAEMTTAATTGAVAARRARVPCARWFTPEVSTRLSTLVDREVLRYLMPSVIGLVRRRRQLECLAAHITNAIHDVWKSNRHPYGQVRFYIFGSVNMRTVLPDGDNDLTVLVDGLLPSAKDTIPITMAMLYPERGSPEASTETEAATTPATPSPLPTVMPSTTDSNSGNKEGTLHMATLADGRPVLAPPAAIGIAAGQLLSGVRDYLHAHHTPIYVDALVSAEVRVLKLAMDGSSYDLTVSQFGGVNCVRFLHEMDAAVGGAHLLKRTLLLLKSWCCYEAHILGGPGGYIGSYAATVMLIAMLNTIEFLEDVDMEGDEVNGTQTAAQTDARAGSEEAGRAERTTEASAPLFASTDTSNGSLLSPLRMVARFLKFYRYFDFDHYCVTAFGPLPLTAICGMPFDLSKLEVPLGDDAAAEDAHTDPPPGSHVEASATAVPHTPTGTSVNPSSLSHHSVHAEPDDAGANEEEEREMTAEEAMASAMTTIRHTPSHARPVRRNKHGVDVNFLGLTPEGEKAIGHLIRRRRKPLVTVSGVKHLLHELNRSRQEDRLVAFQRVQACQQTHASQEGSSSRRNDDEQKGEADEQEGAVPPVSGPRAASEEDRAGAGAQIDDATAPAATALERDDTQAFASQRSTPAESQAASAPSGDVQADAAEIDSSGDVPKRCHRFAGLNRAGRVEADADLLCPSCNSCAFPVRSMNVLDPLRWSSNMVRGVSRNHLQRILRAFEEGLRRFQVASEELAAGDCTADDKRGDEDGEVEEGRRESDRKTSQSDAERKSPTAPPTVTVQSEKAPDRFSGHLAENSASEGSVNTQLDGLSSPLVGIPAEEPVQVGYPAPNSTCTQREVNVLRFIFESTITAIQRNSAVNCPWDVPMYGSDPDTPHQRPAHARAEAGQTAFPESADERAEMLGSATSVGPRDRNHAAASPHSADFPPTTEAHASETGEGGKHTVTAKDDPPSSLLHACPQCEHASIFCTPDIPLMCQPQVTFDSPALEGRLTETMLAHRRRQGPLGEQLLPSDQQLADLGLHAYLDDRTFSGSPVTSSGCCLMQPVSAADATMMAAESYPFLSRGTTGGGGRGAGGGHHGSSSENYVPMSSDAHSGVGPWMPGGPYDPMMGCLPGPAYGVPVAPYGSPHPFGPQMMPAHGVGNGTGGYPLSYGPVYGGGGGDGRGGVPPGMYGEMDMMGYGPDPGHHGRRGFNDGYPNNTGPYYGPMPGHEMNMSPHHYAPSPNQYQGGGGGANRTNHHNTQMVHRRVMSGQGGYLSDTGGSAGGARRSGGGGSHSGARRHGTNPPPQPPQPQQPLVVTIGKRPSASLPLEPKTSQPGATSAAAP